MNLQLEGKNALVCGSSKGIGKAAAIELALLGANVTLVARNEEKLLSVLQTLDTSKGQQHDYLLIDYADLNQLQATIAHALEKKNYHILVNNTGGPPAGPVMEAKVDAFVQAFSNHLICNHLMATMLIEGMKKDNYGRIINIVSTSVKQPLDGLGVSNTTRAAVAGWAKTLSNEVARFGITVNNVLPGATRTERLQEIIAGGSLKKGTDVDTYEKEMKKEIPMGRFAEPEEIAALVAFLSSPAAAYITGMSIAVDGGRTKGL
ncbi:MAG: SDR family oxidoreductase [Saprospiraceae bacterium]